MRASPVAAVVLAAIVSLTPQMLRAQTSPSAAPAAAETSSGSSHGNGIELQPEQVRAIGQALFQGLSAAAVQSRLEALAQPENAKLMAQGKRLYYLALVQSGFKPEEAMRILLATPVPSGALFGP